MAEVDQIAPVAAQKGGDRKPPLQVGQGTIGEVVALQAYGAQDILSVRTLPEATASGEWLLPFIHDVILDVDLDARRITVHLPEGMDACFTPGS